MPLPPNASITDVINKLSELEGINQKTELASVIGAPATSTDTVAQQIVKLQDSKDLFATKLSSKGVPTVNTEPIDDMIVKIDDIVSTPKQSSGTTTSSSVQGSFYYHGTTTGPIQRYYVNVSGLTFRPSRVVLHPVAGVLNNYDVIYNKKLGNVEEHILATFIPVTQNTLQTASYQNNMGDAYVNETSFKLPVQTTDVQYNWYAYE